MRLHIHERHRQETAILLQPSDHAFLPLRHEQESLRADARERCHGAFDFFFAHQFESAASLGMFGFGHNVYYSEDVDAAQSGEILAANEGGADADEVLTQVWGVFRRAEGNDGEGGGDFAGVERVRVDYSGCGAIEELEGAAVYQRRKRFVFRRLNSEILVLGRERERGLGKGAEYVRR